MPRRGPTPRPITSRHEASDQSKPHPPSKSRMQFPRRPHARQRENGRISTVRVQNLKCLEGNCMRNWSSTDERPLQGLRTRIDTFTMRACSGSSAKILAHRGPSRSSSAKNSPRTPPSAASPVQNSPRTPENTRFGHFSACSANVFTDVDRPVRAGEFLLRAQPPLRLNTRPPTSVPQHSGTPHRQGRSTYSRRPLHPRSGNSC